MHLPQELWLEVFECLVPAHELTITSWELGPGGCSNGFAIVSFAPHDAEDETITDTFDAVAYTADIFFRGSQDAFWQVCVRHASWLLTWQYNQVSGISNEEHIKFLEERFDTRIQHLIAQFDDASRHQQRQGWTGEDMCGAWCHAVRLAEDLVRLKTFRIFIDLWDPETPKRGNWAHGSFLEHFLYVGSLGDARSGKTLLQWKRDVLARGASFKIVVRSMQKQHEDDVWYQSFKHTLEEDITEIWDGVREVVEEMAGDRYHKLTRDTGVLDRRFSTLFYVALERYMNGSVSRERFESILAHGV